MVDKEHYRKQMLSFRNSLPDQLRSEKDQMIYKKIIRTKEYQQCTLLLTYLNMGSEVNTRTLIKKALLDQKTVGLPIAFYGSRQMEFYQIEDLDHLVKSSYGAYEPVKDENNLLLPNEHTLIIVPGCAFNKEGYRMGYGGGYYDTYINRFQYGTAIGICYDEQMVEDLLLEEHDQRLHGIYTDKEDYIWQI